MDRCRNCNSLEHREKRCLQSLECGNCGLPGHTPNRCPVPHVARCSVCRSTEHRQEACNVCSYCGQAGHKRKSCPVNPMAAREMGHERKGRLRDKKSGLCMICPAAENATKKCPVQGKCKLCGRLGHRKKHCPRKWCTLCQEFGHSHAVCQTRLNSSVAGSESRATSAGTEATAREKTTS
ncbi:hypothetical protein N658DRAFT_416191 [Parathielavia hyrcaniae]|uniref:CCHC-type domain-containing protein n=1 Tax=Parathielavia hyrcaniae TaxID=113614 RepID=A0AAN6Q916_9PEZI|nr:hypothetical protein N658DRAFT_416191 [Parathielavia hyrcaniae]